MYLEISSLLIVIIAVKLEDVNSQTNDHLVVVDRSNLTNHLKNNLYTIEFHGSNVIHTMNMNETSRIIFYVKLRDEILKYLNNKNTRKSSTITSPPTTTIEDIEFEFDTTFYTITLTTPSPSLSSPYPSPPSPSPPSPSPPSPSSSSPSSPSPPPSTIPTTDPHTTSSSTTIAITRPKPREPPPARRKKRKIQNGDEIYSMENLQFIKLDKHLRNQSFLVTIALDAVDDDDLREAIQHIQDHDVLVGETGLSVKTFYKGFPDDDDEDDDDNDDDEILNKEDNTWVVLLIGLLLLFLFLLVIIIIVTWWCCKRKNNRSININQLTTKQLMQLTNQHRNISDNDGWIVPMNECSTIKR